MAFPFSLNGPNQQICLFYCPEPVFIPFPELCLPPWCQPFPPPPPAAMFPPRPSVCSRASSGHRSKRNHPSGSAVEGCCQGLRLRGGWTNALPRVCALSALVLHRIKDGLWRQSGSVRRYKQEKCFIRKRDKKNPGPVADLRLSDSSLIRHRLTAGPGTSQTSTFSSLSWGPKVQKTPCSISSSS